MFYGVFREKLIYIINIWFNFVFGPFFEQDSLSVKFHYFGSLFEKVAVTFTFVGAWNVLACERRADSSA